LNRQTRDGVEAGAQFKNAWAAGQKRVIAQVLPEPSTETHALIGGIDEKVFDRLSAAYGSGTRHPVVQ
jgi:hypothetical protein